MIVGNQEEEEEDEEEEGDEVEDSQIDVDLRQEQG